MSTCGRFTHWQRISESRHSQQLKFSSLHYKPPSRQRIPERRHLISMVSSSFFQSTSFIDTLNSHLSWTNVVWWVDGSTQISSEFFWRILIYKVTGQPFWIWYSIERHTESSDVNYIHELGPNCNQIGLGACLHLSVRSGSTYWFAKTFKRYCSCHTPTTL